MNTVAICREIAKWNIGSTIATTDFLGPAQAESRTRGATLSDFPEGADKLDIRIFPVSWFPRWSYAPGMGRFLKDQVADYDCVHVHSMNLYPQFAAWRWTEKRTVPLIVSPRGALDPWVRSRRRWIKIVNDAVWQSRMLNGASLVHLTSLAEREGLSSTWPSSEVAVIPNGVNTGRFGAGGDAQRFRHDHLGNYEGSLILNHGRLSEKKGLDLLVRALAVVQRRLPARLVLVGADDEGVGEGLVRLAKSLGLGSDLILVPGLSGQELVDAVTAADVWCLPSYAENFGLAVFEAMAAGRAVVTSPHVNTAADAAANNALVVVANTSEDIGAALVRLLENPKERSALGLAGAEYAKRFSWDAVAPQYVRMYEDVVARHQSGLGHIG